ncbi:MAG: PAS domain S-box protein [Oscillatoriophycideae cyanobacterium NC_groundwater_1537_Pr4_S-0.65um_50_18]|nr:PAS domain S-box protein [Oscillatoriophycideae cyanobacterium NC_groundwater_1537_Pr4_S-0.65um_50_18]
MTSIETPLRSEQINLLDQVLAGSTDHICILDRAGRCWYASPASLVALGLQARDVVGKTWRELNRPAEAMAGQDAEREVVFQTGVAVKGETSFSTIQGTRYYEYVIAPILGKDGATGAVTLTCKDITERKPVEEMLQQLKGELELRVAERTLELVVANASLRSEMAERLRVEQAFQASTEALIRSENRYRSLVTATTQAVWTADPEGKTREDIPGWRSLTGQTEAEARGWGWMDALHPDDRQKTAAAWRLAVATKQPYEIEHRVRMQDGCYRSFIGRAAPVMDKAGNICEWIGAHTDITERKHTEQRLEEGKAILHLFAQYAPAGIAMFDREMRYVMVSQRWADRYHLGSLEALVGRSHYEVFPEIPERWRQIHQRCLAGAIETCDEDLFVRGDGTQQWLRWEIHPWYAGVNKIGGIIIFSEDITLRKQAEASILQLNHELQQKVTELQTLLDVIPIGIGIAEDPKCQNIRVNPAFAEALGIPPTVNASLSAPEAERPKTFKVYQNGREMAPEELPLQYAATHGVEIRDLEVEVVWQDGTEVSLLEYAAPLLDEQGQIRGSVGAFLNISERKRAEAALRESEERYRILVQNFPNGAIFLFDHDLRYVLAEGQGLAEVDLDRSMLEGKAIEDAFDRETCRVLEPYYRETLAGKAQIVEISYADRSYRNHFLPLYDDQGSVKLGMLMNQDVTLQKQAEEVLKTSRDELERQVQARTTELQEAYALLKEREREFRTLVENTPDVITRHDRQYRCVYINPACIQSIGMPPEFFLGKQPSELGYPEDLARFWENSLETVFTSGKMQIDEFTTLKGDQLRNHQVYVVPEREADSTITSVMTIGRDITSLRQAEASIRTLAEELQRSNHELEQFAYIASHDLQEPLRAITSFTQMLAKRYQGQLDAKADTYIEFIVDGAIRMQHLIRDLLAYSRVGRHELKRQPVDFNAVLERVKRDLQVAIAESQGVITADALPTVTADSNQMANLLLNLISNSLKYRSEAAPQIHISAKVVTTEVSPAASQNNSQQLTTPIREWLFSLRDNGIGIEPQYADRIFGIFQRLHTSDEYSGTGLGLAICRKIVERHDGRIWIESEFGQGATFFFTIPIMRTHDGNPRQTTHDSLG